MDNANKHCRNGRITIEGSRDAGTGTIQIMVKDTGNGMPNAEIERLLRGDEEEPADTFRAGKVGFILVRHFLGRLGGSMQISWSGAARR